MATVKMKTEHAYKHGQTNIIPYAGAVNISNEGIIEVASIEIAEQIVKADIGFSIVTDGKKRVAAPEVKAPPVQVEKSTTTAAANALEEDLDDEDDDEELLKEKSESSDLEGGDKSEEELEGNTGENQELIKALDSPELTLKAMQEMAKNSELPRKEWGNMNKENLIVYLKSKLTSK